MWQFPCGQWLEVCDGCGGKLEVELEVGGQSGGESSTEKEKGELFMNYRIGLKFRGT